MKSKIRKIVVRNTEFKWNVKKLSPDFVCLRIWTNSNRSMPWVQVRYRFNDPWIYFGEIVSYDGDPNDYLQLKPLTPKKVAELTEQIIGFVGIPTDFRNSLNYLLKKEGKLVEIEDALLVKINDV